MSKTRSRIVLNFYDDDYKDLAILQMLDELVSKRNRTYKVKDLLLEVFQQNGYKERFKEIEEEQKKCVGKQEVKIKNNSKKIKEDVNEIYDIENSLSGWSEE